MECFAYATLSAFAGFVLGCVFVPWLILWFNKHQGR